MKTFKYLACLFAGSIILACETPLELTPEQTAPRMVLNCSITNDVPIQVYVSRSVFFLDPAEPSYVTDATVKIFINDALAETVGSGHYVGEDPYKKYVYSSSVTAKYGDKVRIEATSQEFPETVSGSTVIPQPVAIKSVVLKPMTVNAEGIRNADLIIRFDDDASQDNFYLLEVIAEEEVLWYGGPDTRMSNYRVRYPDKTFYADSDNGSLLGGGDYGYDPYNWQEYIFFSDKAISGASNYPVAVNLADDSNENLSFDLSKMDNVQVIFCKFDPHYYQYLKVLQTARHDLNDAFYDPTQFYSNIVGGIGLVGSRSEVVWHHQKE